MAGDCAEIVRIGPSRKFTGTSHCWQLKGDCSRMPTGTRHAVQELQSAVGLGKDSCCAVLLLLRQLDSRCTVSSVCHHYHRPHHPPRWLVNTVVLWKWFWQRPGIVRRTCTCARPRWCRNRHALHACLSAARSPAKFSAIGIAQWRGQLLCRLA